MENKQSGKKDLSPAEAVLFGALSPGVNAPTWTTLKTTFLMLVLSLAGMLGLAFSSSDSALTLHVLFLVLITASLFMLLSWYRDAILLIWVWLPFLISFRAVVFLYLPFSIFNSWLLDSGI